MSPWTPARILVRPESMEDDLGRRLAARPGSSVEEALPTGLRLHAETLVARRLQPVRVNREGGQALFHLVRGCPLGCRFCSLLWAVPRRPYVEVFTNVAEILETVEAAARASPGLRFVTGEATDMLALEPLTGHLARAVTFFAERLRGVATLEFLTRRSEVEPLLGLRPRGTVWFGVSLTPEAAAARWEPGTSPVEERIAALARAAGAGYLPLVNLAPLSPEPGWQEDLVRVLDRLADAVEPRRIECEARWHKEADFAVLESLGQPTADLRRGLVRRGDFHTLSAEEHRALGAFLEPELRRRFPRAEVHVQALPDPEFRYG